MVDLNNIIPDQTENKLPDFNPGDRIRVQVKVVEGDKERLQPFEGDVISVRGSGASKTFTIRKISSGVGVERIFPYYSPKLAKIDVIKRGHVRRAKLYYLRKLSGRAAKIKERS